MNLKVSIIGLFCFWVVGCEVSYAQKLTDTYYTVDDFSESGIIHYFEEKKSLDSIEGIWESDFGFRVAISRFHDEWHPKKNRYRMVVIDNSSKDSFWKQGYVKAFITAGKKKGDYKVDYFTMSGKKLWVYGIKLKGNIGMAFSLNKRGLYEIYRKIYPVLPKLEKKDQNLDRMNQEEKMIPVPRLY